LTVRWIHICIKVHSTQRHESMAAYLNTQFHLTCVKLRHAVKQHDLNTLRALITDENINALILDDEPHPQWVGAKRSLLHCAVEMNDVLLVRFLIEKHADPMLRDSRNYTPIHVAAIHGSNESAHILFTWGVNIEVCPTPGETALYLAAIHGNVEMMNILLGYGATIYTKMNTIGTRRLFRKPEVLHAAVSFAGSFNGTTGPMRCLINQRRVPCPMNIIDANGHAPIHIAIKGGKDDVVKTLLEAGADPGVFSNDKGLTALHMLANGDGTLDMMKQILEDKRAGLDEKSERGNTALHIAARQLSVARLECLLMAGANPFIRNRDKLTPSEFAKISIETVDGKTESHTTLMLDAVTDEAMVIIEGIERDNRHSRVVAFLSGNHNRLGEQSHLRETFPEILRMIADKNSIHEEMTISAMGVIATQCMREISEKHEQPNMMHE